MSTLEDTRCPDCGLTVGEHTETCPQYTGAVVIAPDVLGTAAPIPEATEPPTPQGLDFAVILANVRELIDGAVAPLREHIEGLEQRGEDELVKLWTKFQSATAGNETVALTPTDEPVASPTTEAKPDEPREVELDAAITEAETTPATES